MRPDPAWSAMIDWFGWYIVLPLLMLYIALGAIALIVFAAVSLVGALRKVTKKRRRVCNACNR